MPHFGRMLRKTLADAYDYLHLLALGSFLFSVGAVLSLSVLVLMPGTPLLRVVGAAFVAVALLGPLWFGLTGLVLAVASHQDPRLGDFAEAVRRHGGRGVPWSLVALGVAGLGALNSYYYLVHLGGTVWWVVGVLFIYLMMFWLLVVLYSAPLLVIQGLTVGRAFKRAALLGLDNVGYSGMVLAQVLAVGVLVGLPLFAPSPVALGVATLTALFVAPGLLALLGVNAVSDLLAKYRADAEPDGSHHEAAAARREASRDSA